MERSAHTWALVLAAGDGQRLRALTTDAAGRAVPKQFCSLDGGSSLLQITIERAQSIADLRHISVIVAGDHRRWWRHTLQNLPTVCVVVQPQNRGTANGILLQLLHVVRLDPEAEVVLLPSDHFVVDEEVLANAVRQALAYVRTASRRIVLLGMLPGRPDPDLGYIVPGPPDGRGMHVVRAFVEKPARAKAQELIERGALLNAFILIANCRALLDLFSQTLPDVLASMQQTLDCRSDLRLELARLYERLPVCDFSRQVLEKTHGPVLRVMPVPECGWSDLGTPARLGQALARIPGLGRDSLRRAIGAAERVDLAVNYQRAMSGHSSEMRAIA